MSGIGTADTFYGDGMLRGVSVTIDQEQIRHVNALLRFAPERALVVYKRAIQRGLSAGRVQANKEIRERYDISNANLNNTDGHSYSTYSEKVMEDGGGVAGYINFAGAKIPLYRFHPQPKTRTYTTRYVNGYGGWRVTTDVSAADVRGQMIRRRTAFIATMPSGHTGIWKRTGKYTHLDKEGKRTSGSKPEFRELWGFSVKDMLDYEPAREAVRERMAEIVSKRIDHELFRELDAIK